MEQEKKQVIDVASRFASLVLEVDTVFARLKEQYGQEVRCQPGCDDCCYAVFTVSSMEAWAIRQELSGEIVEDRALLARLQRRAAAYVKEMEEKQRVTPISAEAGDSRLLLAKWRIRCPMLEDSQQCAIYKARPLTCRIYGLPLSIEGRGHVCGISGFEKGGNYPTIKMENIHAYLLELSQRLARASGAALEEGNRRIFLHKIISALAAEKAHS